MSTRHDGVSFTEVFSRALQGLPCHVLDLGAAPTEADVATAVATIDRWYDDPHGAPDWRAAQTLRCALEVVEELA